MAGITGFTEAMQKVAAAASVLPRRSEDVPLRAAVGRILADNLLAGHNIQPFDNAAMDGYAVRAGDILDATSERAVSLPIGDNLPAGMDASGEGLSSGSCRRIMTGAPIPAGCDAIVPFEEASEREGRAFFTAAARVGAHIRRAGEDFRKGMPVLGAGGRITPSAILPLAALGTNKVTVYERPKVAVITTGLELVDDLSCALQKGKIYNANAPYMEAVLPELGAVCCRSLSVGDDAPAFCAKLSQILEMDAPDIVVSSGAVSAGSYDFVRGALESLGAEVLFHKVLMRPGKPNLFARLPNGALYFGLPGNPAATAVGLRFFVGQALRILSGLPPEAPQKMPAANTFGKKAGFRMFLKAKVEADSAGHSRAAILPGQESFMVNPFLAMNAWVSMPEEAENIREGDLVDVYPVLPAA